MLNRTIAPPVHDAVTFKYQLPPISKRKLSNGLPLYWLNAGVQDVVEIDWVFPAGLWQEPKPALAHATAGLLKNGTTKRTAHQIHEAIEFYGASLKVSANNDFATVSLYALTQHLPMLLPIVHEILTEASFPDEEVAIHKQNAIQRLLVNLKQCEFVANQKIDALIFGEAHPYGRFSKKEKIEALTRDDIYAFYKQAYNLAGVTIFMGGKVGEAEVSLIDSLFGKEVLQRPVAEDLQFAAPAPSEQKHRVVNDENGVQGAIRIGRSFIGRKDPDFPAMVVLNTLFGGYFGSRLMSNIREDKGYTYGIYSGLSPYLHGGDMIIHTEAGRDVLEAAVAEVYKEMELLQKEPADEEELLLVKNFLLGGLLGDLDGPFQVLQRWRTLIMNGLNEAHFDRNISVYKNVTAAELQALAQKYYNVKDFYEVVVV